MLEGFTPIPPEFAARYRSKGYWLDQPMGQYFRAVFDRWDNRVAVVAGNTRLTYRELGDRIDHLARHLLDLGMRLGIESRRRYRAGGHHITLENEPERQQKPAFLAPRMMQ